MTDAELVERARAGDTDAFGELVERYQGVVYRTARAALRSPSDADDVAQEAFVSAYRKLTSFRGDAEFKTWLLAITWNAARTHRRSVWRWFDRHTPTSVVAVHADRHGRDVSQEEALVRQDLWRRVQKAAMTLPRKYRTVMMLAATSDHTIDEVAEILGIPAGTVKWRMSEGRKLLKAKLARLGLRDE